MLNKGFRPKPSFAMIASSQWGYTKGYTHFKFNMAPEVLPSEKESSLPTVIFRGLC